jgi:hypothetical protein
VKVPLRTIKLAEALEDEGYGEYYFSLPRSLLEGQLFAVQQRNIESSRLEGLVAAEEDDAKRELLAKQAMEYRRESSAKMLDLITEWNLDDAPSEPPAEGSALAKNPRPPKVLPLPRTVGDPAKKVEILAQLPVEVVGLIGQEIWNLRQKPKVPEATLDFSSASSGQQGTGS